MTLTELEPDVQPRSDREAARDRARPQHPQRRFASKLACAALLAAAAMFAALCGPALCGLVYTADDLGAFHLPLRAFYARALENGDAFDWCPDLYGGFYLTGEGQIGPYHPLHWLLYRCMPLPLAWDLECLASYPFLFIGAWLFLRRRLQQPAALFGATVLTFCGFNLLHFVHVNAVAVLAHVPWLLYAIDGLHDADRRRDRARAYRGVALIAALTASQLLLGYPQYVIYSLLAEGLYLAFAMRGSAQMIASPSSFKFMAIWSLAKLLGLALAAVQILPTLEAVADSVRQNVDASFSATGSLHPLNIIQLIAPYLFATRVVGQNTHELGLYAGVVPLLLMIVAIINRRSANVSAPERSLLRFALLLTAIGGLIAIGGYGPVQPLLAELPLIGYLRFPCRAIVLIQLGIGLLAAIGFGIVVRNSSGKVPSSEALRRKFIRAPRKTFALIVLASIAAAVTGPLMWPEYIASPWLVWCGPVLAVVAVWIVRCACMGRKLALYGLVCLSAIDLGLYGLSYAVYRDVTPLDEYIARTPTPAAGEHARVALDLAASNGDALRAGNQVLLAGYARIDGYAGLEPARSLDYRNIQALRVAGVRFVAASASVEDQSQLGDDHDGWLELSDPLPRARLVQAYKWTENPREDVNDIDPTKEVLVEAQDSSAVIAHLGTQTETTAPIGVARIAIDRPGFIVFQTVASHPSILVLNESFHRGWTATVDGAPVQTLRPNGDFLGCVVNPGRSTVEFRFAPASLQYGRFVSICGLSLLGMLLAASRPGARLMPFAWRPPRFQRPQGA